MKKDILWLAGLWCCWSISQAHAQDGPAPATPSGAERPDSPRPDEEGAQLAQRLAHGVHLYDYGSYPQARQVLQALEQEPALREPAHAALRKKLYLYLGNTTFLLGGPELSRDYFWKLLQLDPLFIPKSTEVPPEIVEVVDDVRRTHRDELRPLVIKQLQAGQPKKNWLVNLVPFGAGQFQNRQSPKAVSLIVGEALSLAASLATYGKLKSDQQPDGTFASDQAALNLRAINWVSSGVFVGLYLYQVIDGMVYYN